MIEQKIQKSQDAQNASIFNLKEFHRTNVTYGIDPSTNLTIFLGETYASLLDTEYLYLIDLDDENYLTFLIQQAKKDLKSYNLNYIIGAVFSEHFNKTMITAFYNADAYHSAPTSLLYVHNTILNYYSKDKSFYFDVKNDPFPYKDREEEEWSSDFKSEVSFLWAQDFLIGMAILMSSYALLLVIERSSKYKRQLFVSGLNAFVYWFATFIYDFGLYIILSLSTLLILSIFQTECLSSIEEIGTLAFLLLSHGLSALFFIYCCTFCSHSSSTVYIGIFLYYFLGLCCLHAVHDFEKSQSYTISEVLNTVFTALMPSYCVGRGIYNVHRNCKSNFICNNEVTQHRCLYRNASFVACCLEYCEDYCLFWSSSHLSLSVSGIGKQLIALAIQPFIFCMILILFEMEIYQNLKLYIKEKRMKYYDESLSSTDKNVLEEADKILSSPVSKLVDENQYLILKDASKFRPQYPVGKLSFGVNKGECFGLIGIEKAGKSTVLKMISGSTQISTGNIYIDGSNIHKCPNKVQDKIGFSFGDYALLQEMTGKETLTLYSRIRGIPETQIPFFISTLTDILKLKAHVPVKNCDFTNRRKLWVATAIIGTPPLILLDGPTDNLDPVACRNTIEALKHALGVGCTILFTTEKMDECQALCKRIGILVRGKLTYLGDFDSLKSQYADGFTLILRVIKTRQARTRYTRQAITLKGSLEEIKGEIEEELPDAILKIEYSTYLNYYVPKQLTKWSKLFSLLEKMKSRNIINDYSVCETTLEQIFSYNVASLDHLKGKKIAEFLKEREKQRV